MSKGIIGKLLPEQVRYFTEKRDLADVVEWAGGVYPPYFIYIDGELVRTIHTDKELYEKDIDVYQLGEELETVDNRVVILDNLGEVLFTNQGQPLLLGGDFHLCYSIEDRQLWRFFADGAGSLCVNEEDSNQNLSVSPSALKAEIFADFAEEEEDEALRAKLIEKVFALQEIARLYPLLEIKVYP